MNRTGQDLSRLRLHSYLIATLWTGCPRFCLALIESVHEWSVEPGSGAINPLNRRGLTGMNVLSGDRSDDAKPPIFPFRLLYRSQPHFDGFRLPDKLLGKNRWY